jgi:hypothetical protein
LPPLVNEFYLRENDIRPRAISLGQIAFPYEKVIDKCFVVVILNDKEYHIEFTLDSK